MALEIPSPHSNYQGNTSTHADSPDDLERRPLSICLDAPSSSSPFPSPSSSFLLPPVLGNHEFAIRPPPSGNSVRKRSIAGIANGTLYGYVNRNLDLKGKEDERKLPINAEPGLQATRIPRPPANPSLSSAPMPTPDANSDGLPGCPATPASIQSMLIPSPIPSPSPFPSISTPQSKPNPTSNRPAPPSPARSRRASSMATLCTPFHAPAPSITISTSIRTAAQIQYSAPRTLTHIRDFAFDPTDERFSGAGALVPRANRLTTLQRKLAGFPNDDDDDDEAGGSQCDDVDDDHDMWEGMDTDPDGRKEDEGSAGGEEEPLYPGLYRAMYAFEPEGTAEMALVEDQTVRVVARGGGVGWAVVVDESVGMDRQGGPRHALVPESYLEVVRLDWEDESEDHA